MEIEKKIRGTNQNIYLLINFKLIQLKHQGVKNGMQMSNKWKIDNLPFPPSILVLQKV